LSGAFAIVRRLRPVELLERILAVRNVDEFNDVVVTIGRPMTILGRHRAQDGSTGRLEYAFGQSPRASIVRVIGHTLGPRKCFLTDLWFDPDNAGQCAIRYD